MNRTAAVVVTYNGEPWIERLLRSVRDSASPMDVIVVDNASTDRTAAIVREEFAEVELIRLAENLGFGAGNNVGISAALKRGAEYVFLLNQDAYLTPDAVGKLESFLDGHRDFDVASPLHCSPDLEHVDLKSFQGYFQRSGHEYFSDLCFGAAKDHYAIGGVNAAAWFVRASAFRKVGGFDPLFFMYCEDDDLLRRFKYHGVRFALVPDARFVHLRQSAGGKPAGRWRAVWKRSERIRSSLVLRLKKPGNSAPFMIALLASEGLLAPLANFIAARDGQLLAASWLASLRVAGELPRIWRHKRLCEQGGAQFLDPAAHHRSSSRVAASASNEKSVVERERSLVE